MNISKRLSQIIERSNLTIKDFAEQCDIPYRSMYNYIRGDREPNLEALAKISQAFDVDLNWLIVGNQDIPNGISTEHFSVEEIQLISKYRVMSKQVQEAIKIIFFSIYE